MIKTNFLSEQISDKFDLFEKNSSEKRNKIDLFIKLLEEKVELDENYSVKLEKIAKSYTNLLDSGTVSLVFAGLKSDLMTKYEIIKSYSKFIKNEVIDILKIHSNRQAIDIDKRLSDYKKLENDLKVSNANLQSLKISLMKINKDVEENESYANCLEKFKCAGDTKEKKVRKKITSLLQTKIEKTTKYNEQFEQHNSLIENFQYQNNSGLLMFKRHEEERLVLLKEITLKILLEESFLVKNSQYDLDKIIKKVDLIDIDNEINKFSSELVSSKINFPKLIPENLTSFYKLEPEIIENNKIINEKDIQSYYESLFQDLKMIKQQQKIELESKFLIIPNLLYKAWIGDIIEEENFKIFDELTSNIVYRDIWTLCFQQNRIMGKFQIDYKGFSNVGKLAEIILNKCFICKDTINGIKSMILLFTFYMVSDSNKNFVQNLLINHPIFQNIEFWSAALYFKMKEEMRQQNNYHFEENESELETSLREKNLIFAQIAAFSQNMLMFNLDKKIVSEFVLDFCKKFELSEVQINNLKRMIDNNGNNNNQIKNKKNLSITSFVDTIKNYKSNSPELAMEDLDKYKKKISEKNNDNTNYYKSEDNLVKLDRFADKAEFLKSPYQNPFKQGAKTQTPLRKRDIKEKKSEDDVSLIKNFIEKQK